MIKNIILSKVTIINFYIESAIKRFKIPTYDTIINTSTKHDIDCEENQIETSNQNKKIHYITYIPSFIEPVVKKGFKIISFERFMGYSINLENFESIESYMLYQFGSKSRSKIRSYLNRLETCFNISYKTYFGKIEAETYHKIMESLEEMITKRFSQRNEEHQAFKDWSHYKNSTYSLINDKKASLFVIYDNDKPIDICLNIHHENVYLNYIRAFDIDYSKFRLGYVDILKQLQWCFEKGYKIFDLGMGIFTYKIQWCNENYKFKNHIIVSEKSVLLRLMGSLIGLLFKFKMYLDKNKIIKDTPEKNQDNSYGNQLFDDIRNFDIIKIDKIDADNKLIVIDIETEDFSFLRKYIYEILYLNFEHKNNVTIYKVNNDVNCFIVKGNKTYKLIQKSN